jgi:hypothetical protein
MDLIGAAGRWQQVDGVTIAPGKAALGGFLPGQPAPSAVFVRGGLDFNAFGQAEGKNMFRVFAHAWCVTVSPSGEDLVAVADLPVGEDAGVTGNAGLFRNLSPCRRAEVFLPFAATGDGLPEAWVGGAFEQKNVERGRVDDDEDGNRLFPGGHDPPQRGREGSSMSSRTLSAPLSSSCRAAQAA